jgi:gluconolactonase
MQKRAFAFLCLVGVSVAGLLAQTPAQAPIAGPPVDYSLGPESQPQAGVPKGTLTQHTLAPGKYYPGTPHNYQIYVPSQYNASRPTPFMIFLDGNGYAGDGIRVPVVFDNLIAKGDLPPMIGIFINPGVLPSGSEQAQNRYERIVQYDSLTPRYSSFLVDELIPAVAKSYNLSNDPNDRGIAGSSTGGVGAFVAAWNRPDQFRRVITLIGSFGNFRGADRLPGLIRIVMQTGRQDLNNYAGSWYIENPRMAAALEFAGYDVRLELGEEAHNARHGAHVMPDMLRWLWREHPKPIEVRAPAPGAGRGIFAQLVPRRELVPAPPNPARQGGAPPAGRQGGAPPAAGAANAARGGGAGPRGAILTLISYENGWEQVGSEYQSTASPAVDKDGNVFFADPVANRIYKSDAARNVTVFKENTNGARALRVGPDGRIYASQPARQRIVSYGPSGDEKTVASNVVANDLAINSKGEMYFVDSTRKTVGHIDAKGQQRVVHTASEIMRPSALSLTPDQAFMWVADGMNRYTWSFQIAPDGSLINGEPFQRLELPEETLYSGVEGLAVDSVGYVWATSAMGIQVCEQPGRCAQILNKPEFGPTPISNIAFGGPERNWLYVTQGSKLFRRAVKRTGVVAWEPIKPPQPGL